MSNRYAVVARTYWGWRLAGLVSLLALPVFLPLGRSFDQFLPFRLCFGLGFFGWGIGYHIMEQFANPRSSLFPRFRVPHLVVAVAVSLPVLTVTTLAIWWIGGKSLLGTAALVMTIFTTALCFTCPRSRILMALIITADLFLIAAMFTSQGRSWYTSLIEGRANVAAAMLLLCSAAVLVTLWVRLMKLDEDMPEYFVPLLIQNPWKPPDPKAQARLSSAAQGRSLEPGWFTRLIERKLPAAGGGLVSDSFWARAHVWRAGMSHVSLGPTTTLAIFGLGVLVVTTVGFETVMTNVLTFPALLAAQLGVMTAQQTWLQRWPRLGYELLRPTRRRDFFRQTSLAFGLEIFDMWFWTLLSGWLIFAIWAPALLRASDIAVLLSLAFACPLSQWAATVLVTTYSRSPFIVLPILILTVLTAMFLHMSYLRTVPQANFATETYLMVAAGAVLLSLAALWLADRRWQRLDLS